MAQVEHLQARELKDVHELSRTRPTVPGVRVRGLSGVRVRVPAVRVRLRVVLPEDAALGVEPCFGAAGDFAAATTRQQAERAGQSGGSVAAPEAETEELQLLGPVDARLLGLLDLFQDHFSPAPRRHGHSALQLRKHESGRACLAMTRLISRLRVWRVRKARAVDPRFRRKSALCRWSKACLAPSERMQFRSTAA